MGSREGRNALDGKVELSRECAEVPSELKRKVAILEGQNSQMVDALRRFEEVFSFSACDASCSNLNVFRGAGSKGSGEVCAHAGGLCC